MSANDFLKLIPSLFEINLNNDKQGKTIFEKLAEFVSFDEGFIYFLSPEAMQLKYTYKNHSNYKIDDVFDIPQKYKKKLLPF